MAETRSRSIRVADDVWEAIQGLPGKTDDALRAVLVAQKPVVDPHAEVGRWFRETWARLENLPEEILEAADAKWAQKNGGVIKNAPTEGLPVVAYASAAEIPGVQKGVGAPKGFSCRCVHSGCQGGKFTGASRYANLCPECEAGGHRGDRHDCVECWEPA